MVRRRDGVTLFALPLDGRSSRAEAFRAGAARSAAEPSYLVSHPDLAERTARRHNLTEFVFWHLIKALPVARGRHDQDRPKVTKVRPPGSSRSVT